MQKSSRSGSWGFRSWREVLKRLHISFSWRGERGINTERERERDRERYQYREREKETERYQYRERERKREERETDSTSPFNRVKARRSAVLNICNRKTIREILYSYPYIQREKER